MAAALRRVAAEALPAATPVPAIAREAAIAAPTTRCDAPPCIGFVRVCVLSAICLTHRRRRNIEFSRRSDDHDEMQFRTSSAVAMSAFAALALGPACSSDDDDDASMDAAVTGEPTDLAGITAAHNQVRAQVNTSGTSGALPALTWDDSLAATATAWARQCKDSDGDGLIDHNPGRSDGHAYYVGENIFASSGMATGAGAVTAWANEGPKYHYDTNTCDSGAVCGHYTQLVWRTTLQVGCAIASCPALKYSSVVVCDYGPGGNINNQKPY